MNQYKDIQVFAGRTLFQCYSCNTIGEIVKDNTFFSRDNTVKKAWCKKCFEEGKGDWKTTDLDINSMKLSQKEYSKEEEREKWF
jgi:hypothetical protein